MHGLSWQDYEPELRADWEQKFGPTGLDWEEIREAHRFGWEASCRPEFADLDFKDVETDLSWHWYRPLSPTEEASWDYVREAVEEGWRKARDYVRRQPREKEQGR